MPRIARWRRLSRPSVQPLNRPIALTTPDASAILGLGASDASVVLPTYNEANLLETLTVKLRDAPLIIHDVQRFTRKRSLASCRLPLSQWIDGIARTAYGQKSKIRNTRPKWPPTGV